MRGTGPAAAVAGAMALAWVGWELWRFAWHRRLIVGIDGASASYVLFDWRGPGADAWPDGGVFTLVVLPGVLALGGLALAGLAGGGTREGTRRLGPGLLALGAVGMFGWACFASAVALGTLLDGVGLPVFATSVPEPFAWDPWARWVFDAGLLACVAALLGVGPGTPLARRALWIAALAVLADSGWRVAVTVLAGQVPALAVGLGVLGWGQGVVWLLLGGLAVGFVALFANVPDRDGPRASAVLAVLAGVGVWLGVQGAALWAAGLLTGMGFQPVLPWPMPEYEPLLAWLRLALVGVGVASLGLGAWRSGPDPELR